MNRPKPIGSNIAVGHCKPGGMARTRRKIKSAGLYACEFHRAVKAAADKVLAREWRTVR